MERFLNYFIPEKYNLDLTINKHKKAIDGIVKVTGEVKDETVKFHAVGLKITDALVNGEKVKYRADGETLEIPKVALGEAEITIYYNGTLNENMQGAYLSTYEYRGKTETVVATQFESHYAREAFPCIDEPAAKAVFELAITVPEGAEDLILANTPVKNVVKNTTEFEPTPRMSTYLLAWVIGRLHGKTIKNAHGVEITSYCTLAQDEAAVDFANEVAARSLEFYDDNFGIKYPLKKLDQVALPDFEAGAMENWGLVTYRESMMLAGETATLGTKKSVALTVAHELSHQWFGDLVTMEWWDDLWLNESFASVMEYYAVDSAYPEFKIFEGFFTGDCFAALMRDACSDVQSVHQDVSEPAEIATLFDGAIVYSKGARLILMLTRLMGWENFCKGVHDYFEKYQYRNTVGDDLWASLRKYAEFEPGELMHAFIDKPGYPVIMGEDGFRKYTQKRFLLDGKMTKSDWPLPEVTEDMSGHYILNLSNEEFEERLRDFDKLGLEERLRLLIDRSLVCRTELAPSDSLLSLVSKFKNENNAAVWNIIAIIIGQLKIFFDFGSAEEKKFKKFVGELVKPKLGEIGLKTRDKDDENTLRLRSILLGLDFYAETEDDLRALAKMYHKDYTKLDKEVRDDILDAKIYLDAEVLDEYLAAYSEIADPEIKFDLMFAMTLMKDENKLDEVLKLLKRTDVVKPQDQLYLFIYLYRNPRVRTKVWNFLVDNWDYVKSLAGDKSLDRYPRLTANVIKTEAEFKAWQDFFMPMKDEPALARAIVIGEKEIRARIELIREDWDGVVKALG